MKLPRLPACSLLPWAVTLPYPHRCTAPNRLSQPKPQNTRNHEHSERVQKSASRTPYPRVSHGPQLQRHAELFQNRLKTAVRGTLTGAEVRFSTSDVALVDATWDVTGWSRPTGEAAPVLKEITTMTMVKTDGKWLITAFQDTESEGSTK